MSKKLAALIGGLATAAASAAIAIVTYCGPENMGAINASISVVEGAVITIVGLFSGNTTVAKK